jgi:hypothetical protein
MLPEINFQASCHASIKTLVGAYCSHCSGDPIEVYIDGHKAELNGDWGLVEPQSEKSQ